MNNENGSPCQTAYKSSESSGTRPMLRKNEENSNSGPMSRISGEGSGTCPLSRASSETDQMSHMIGEKGGTCSLPRVNSESDRNSQMSRMSGEDSSACQMSRCPDHCGTLPPCAGLAVPYVPFQQNVPKKYTQDEALSNGTLFPGLNLPFHMKVDGSCLPSGPLVELQALEFVTLELGMYLDTHPDDMEAFTLFKQYTAMEKAAKTEYEARFGPLMKSSAAAGDSYRWLQDPWPWNYQQNEVK